MLDDDRMQHNKSTYAENTGSIGSAGGGMELTEIDATEICGTDVMQELADICKEACSTAQSFQNHITSDLTSFLTNLSTTISSTESVSAGALDSGSSRITGTRVRGGMLTE